MLVRIDRDIPPGIADAAWLEGELARGGARDAHLTAEGKIAVIVAAGSPAEATELVDHLLRRVSHRPAIHLAEG
jgi:hypothetical protein